MNDLSMLQKRVLVFIKSFMNNYGYPPTVREIAKGTDIGSTSTVHSSLNALEQKGYIYRDVGQSRSIVLAGVTAESGVYSIPLLDGKDESKIGFVDIPKSLVVDRQGVFALKCFNSLEEKSISSGDVLIVKSVEIKNGLCFENGDVKDGDTVVYKNFTVGVYWDSCGKKYGSTELFDDSQALEELYFLDYYDSDVEYEMDKNESDEKIIGKVIALIRHF